MSRLELPAPVRMCRVAIATQSATLRDVLVRLAGEGAVQLAGDVPPPEGEASDALRRLDATMSGNEAPVAISPTPPDLHVLEKEQARDLVAGEVELHRRERMALVERDVSILVGWTPAHRLDGVRERLGQIGAAVVDLPPPPGEIPPTALSSTKFAAPFRILVDTYGVLPYSNVDPTAFAAIAFIIMFGMMFGDVGHGLLLVALGLLLSRVRHGRMARVRPSWPLIVAAGAAGTLFGLLYGECFGPTGLVPTLWIAPLEQPIVLLASGVVLGSTLLAVSYLLGAGNRWRERGPGAALFAQGGLAGGLVFAGLAMAAVGWIRDVSVARVAGLAAGAFGILLLFAGTYVQAGGGLGGISRALIEVMDSIVRIGGNVVSFARLAAFGMTHAALSLVTLQGAQHLAGGLVGWVLAALLFVLGTAVAFALEGMVATIQALRLEYYELFSRVFAEEGRPFTPFAFPVQSRESIA